jgi:PAS domain S-box-containing protein
MDLHRAIVGQAPDAIIFADRDGAIRIWNAAAEAIFGFTADEVLGTSLDVIIPERFRAAHWAGFREALARGTTKYAGRVLTTRSLRKDGARLYVDLSFSLVHDDAGVLRGALAIARDCTERQLAARASRPGA